MRETLSTSEDDSAAEETLPRWTYLLQLLIVGVVFLFVCFATTKKQILTTTDSMWLVEMVESIQIFIVYLRRYLHSNVNPNGYYIASM